MGHPLGDCVGVGSVAPDLSGVDRVLITVPPVVVEVEVAHDQAVGVPVEQVYNFRDVFGDSGGVDVEKVSCFIVQGDCNLEEVTGHFAFS